MSLFITRNPRRRSRAGSIPARGWHRADVATPGSEASVRPATVEQWLNLSKETRLFTDRVGMPIDRGVLDTVVAFRAWGFVTKASCEGHLDHGLPYPWIDIGLDDAIEAKIVADRKALFDEQERRYPGQDRGPSHDALRQAVRPMSLEANRLVTLLDRFYSTSAGPVYRATLVPSRFMPHRLRLQPAGVIVTTTYEAPGTWLPVYQTEMNRFGQWLRDRWLQGDD